MQTTNDVHADNGLIDRLGYVIAGPSAFNQILHKTVVMTEIVFFASSLYMESYFATAGHANRNFAWLNLIVIVLGAETL